MGSLGMSKWGFALILFLGTGAFAGEQKSARLIYARMDGASSCPDPLSMEKAVAARIGYNPFHDDAIEVIRVFVELRRDVLGARLEMRSGTTLRGKRDLESTSRDCSELAAALSLAIAIAIDPQTWIGKSSSPAAVQATPPIAAASVMAPPPPPPLVTAEASSIKLQAALGVMGLWGTSPNFTGGLVARVTVGGARWSLSLDGRGELPQTMRAGPGEVSVTNIVGSVSPCAHFSVVGACGVVAGGITRAAASGLIDSREGIAPFFQAGARVRADVPLTERLGVGASFDAMVPLVRAVLNVGSERLWATQPITLFGSLLLTVSLL
jgi:hypothetical protein